MIDSNPNATADWIFTVVNFCWGALWVYLLVEVFQIKTESPKRSREVKFLAALILTLGFGIIWLAIRLIYNSGAC